MLPQQVAGSIHDFAGLFISSLAEKLAIVAGGDEADVLAVGLVGVGEAGVQGQPADLRLGVVAYGHEGGGKLVLAHTEEHVGLVLVGVNAATEGEPAGAVGFDAGVVAGGDVAGVEHPGALGQKAELDLVVAGNAGMGGAPAFVLALEVVDDEGAELALDVEDVVGDAEDAADGAGVFDVVDGAAAAVVIGEVGLVYVVELHGYADDFVALPVEQEGGH